MENKLRLGMVGMGCRGYEVMKTVLGVDGVALTCVCDLYPDRTEKARAKAEKMQGFSPRVTDDWHTMTDKKELDAVLVTCSWEPHIEMAVAFMEAGIPVGVEVGGAYSVEDCFLLVRTFERTGTPVMLLENCCYGRYELMVMNMAEQGLFGEIVHCEGGYRHDLRREITFGKENRHYRLRNYLARCCENYPTHELGPISQILHINRGNRMLSLVSVASKAKGLHDYIGRTENADRSLLERDFAQGDVVTTIIKCANGETVTLTLDTTLPRAYSRQFTVQGTRGMYSEENNSVYLDTDHDESMHFSWKKQWNNAESYLERYDHPIWREFLADGLRGGHGGMDYLVYRDFVRCVRKGLPMPIDAYDMASLMCISALSEQSIAMGGAPVAIPDFTSGRWLTRT